MKLLKEFLNIIFEIKNERKKLDASNIKDILSELIDLKKL